MAQKRMFDKAVIDTDRFMDLPVSAKALYFLLGMEADDEGFVSYKKVIRIHGGNDDDIKILHAKNFVIKFETGVVVITDWRKNNWLDSRRIKKTEYVTEKELLAVTKDNKYMLSKCLADVKPEEYRGEESRGVQSSTEESICENKFSREIPKIIEMFKKINPSLSYGNKTERKACQTMIEKFGEKELKKMIELALEAQSKDRYCPRATKPSVFYSKLGDFLMYFKSSAQESKLIEL